MKRRRMKIGSKATPPDAPEEAEGGRSGIPRVVWLLGGLVALVGALYLVAAIILHAVVDADDVARWVEPRASAALNRQVTLEGASPSIFPLPSLDATGLRVENLSGFEGPPLARVERVRLELAILPLLTGTVRVRQVTVDGPVLHLAVNADGESNYGDLVPESGEVDEGDADPPFSVEVREIAVRRGRITVMNEPRGESMVLVGLTGETELREEEDDWQLRATALADSLMVRRPVLGERAFRTVGPSVRLEAVSHSSFHWIQVNRGELALADASVRFTGRVDSLRSTRRTVDVRLVGEGIPLADVVSALPDTVRGRLPAEAEGRLSLDVALAGFLGPEIRPRAQGTVTLEDLRLGQDGVSLLEHLSGELTVHGDTIETSTLTGSLLGGALAVDGSIWGEGPRVALRVDAAPELGRLQELDMLAEGSSVSGDAEVRASVEGSLDAPEELRLDGTVALVGTRVGHPELGESVYIPRGDLQLQASEARWADVTVVLGEDPVVTSGRATGLGTLLVPPDEGLPHVEAQLRGARLRLDRIFPPEGPESRPTYAQLAFAHVGGRSLGGQAPVELARARGLSRPGALPVGGWVDLGLDTLEYGPYHLVDVTGRAEMARESLTLTDLVFRTWGGTIRGGLALELGPDPEEPFSLTLEAVGVEGPAFLSSLTPLGRTVQGTLHLNVNMEGTMDALLLPSVGALAGEGSLAAEDGGLASNPVTGAVADFLALEAWRNPTFSTWIAPFELREGRVHLRDSQLESGLGMLRVAGSIGLGGQIDLALGLSVPPEQLASISLRRTGISSDVVSRLQQAGSHLELGLRLRGPITGPTVEPDAQVASGALAEQGEAEVREAVDDQVERAREELRDRATGFLERLRRRAGADTVGAGPDTVPVPSDTVRVDTASDTAAAGPDSAAPPADTDTVAPPAEPDTVAPPPDTLAPPREGVAALPLGG